MPISGRPDEYASDLDYADRVGTEGGIRPMVSRRRDEPKLPGPCVPCAAEGRIAVAGECDRHPASRTEASHV